MRPHGFLFLAVASLLAAAAGCTQRPLAPSTDNEAPTAELAPGSKSGALGWRARDVDGRVDHYLIAVDPPLDGRLIEWTETTRTEFAFVPAPAGAIRRDPFQIIAIRAVDDDGAESDILLGAVFETSAAPLVQITSPRPSSLVTLSLPSSFTVQWEGTDPDGDIVEYRYTVLSSTSEFPIEIANADPDSLRRYYAPDFKGWETTEKSRATLDKLDVGETYIFAVVAIDPSGAYTPIFNLNSNMLRFRVTSQDVLGPRLTVWSSSFWYRTASGGWVPDREVFIETPSGTALTFNWAGDAAFGLEVVGYRWALDIKDVNDETPRKDKDDFSHWSELSKETSATVGPFSGGEQHRFYVQAVDNFGGRTLLVIRIDVVGGLVNRPLLIVDDTRFLGDQIDPGTGCAQPPVGAWPTAAELDTFLFARGGFPWKCYPAGTLSEPGIFAGYDFDTLGTRTGNTDLTIRLAVLQHYEHVVWLVDARGAENTRPGSDPFDPITALRYMSGPGRTNTLAAYAQGGGRVWLAGGGGARATLLDYDAAFNNDGDSRFTHAAGELVPGRFMYDHACWQSAIGLATLPAFVQRMPGAGGSLPATMRPKAPATDPLPPGRNPTAFYKAEFALEYLSEPNSCADAGSRLDSLYRVVTFSLPPSSFERVTMTHHDRTIGGPVTFSGFAIWDFARDDGRALVDYVLQDLWGLSKQVTAAGARPALGPAPGAPVTFDEDRRVQRPLSR